MNVGSLFSGIGGLDLGLARAGFRHAFFCESDAWRRDVLAHHWPGVPIYEDVREVNAAAWSPRIGEGRRALGGVSDNPSDNPSLLHRSGAGGEHAEESEGARVELRPGSDIHLLCGGFPCQDVSVAGRRAGLAGERSGLFHEFARIAESLRPRWLLVENVPGLLSSNGGRDFGVVLGTLADIGYGVGWRIVDSRFFGVPQRRRRVFIVGALAESDTRAGAERAGEVLAVGTRCPGHPATGTEARENAAAASISGLGSGGPDDNDGYNGRLVAHALRRDPGGTGQGHNTTYVVGPLTGGNTPHGPRGSAQRMDDHAVHGNHLIAAPLSHGSNPNSNAAGRRREDDENLVTAFYPTGGSKDGFWQENVSPPMKVGTGVGAPAGIGIAQTVGVRRLTPTECERLQGLPDGWTDFGPDTRRYAALGDAVTASVSEWIGRRLIAA